MALNLSDIFYNQTINHLLNTLKMRKFHHKVILVIYRKLKLMAKAIHAVKR